jgi:hypothetical protein
MKLLIIFSILCRLTLSSLSTSSLRKRRRTREQTFTLIIQKFASIALAQALRKTIIDKELVNCNGSLTLSIQDVENRLTSITILRAGEHLAHINADTYIGYDILVDDPLIISLKVNYFKYIFQVQNSKYFYVKVMPQLDKLNHFGSEKLLHNIESLYKQQYEKLIKSENPLVTNKKDLQESLDWTNKVIEYLIGLDS